MFEDSEQSERKVDPNTVSAAGDTAPPLQHFPPTALQSPES